MGVGLDLEKTPHLHMLRMPLPLSQAVGYTRMQREAFLKGLRILAKVAVRAHMERQAPGSKTAPDDGCEEDE